MNKTVTGRIGDITISKTIINYQSNIPEQILTTKKEILNQFAALGFNPNDVTFDEL